MPPRRHTHFYGKKPMYTYQVWACNLPDCTHFWPIGTQNAMLDGKLSICWNCAKEFRLDMRALENDKPCCSEKCQLEYSRTEDLTRIPEPEMENESSTMCEKCKIRLKHGSLNWCWQCTMS